MSDPNPYASPQSHISETDESSPDTLVIRGRTILLLMIGVNLVFDVAGTIWYRGFEGPSIRGVMNLAITYGLWYAVWCGYRWALTLVKIRFGVGALLNLIFWLLRPEGVSLLWSGFSLTITCLAMSKSVLAFVQFQQEKRRKRNG